MGGSYLTTRMYERFLLRTSENTFSKKLNIFLKLIDGMNKRMSLLLILKSLISILNIYLFGYIITQVLSTFQNYFLRLKGYFLF